MKLPWEPSAAKVTKRYSRHLPALAQTDRQTEITTLYIKINSWTFSLKIFFIWTFNNWIEQGAHTSGFNSVGYGVCFLGDFTLKQPTQAAIQVQSLYSGTIPLFRYNPFIQVQSLYSGTIPLFRYNPVIQVQSLYSGTIPLFRYNPFIHGSIPWLIFS